jgi:hypothetical protein
MINELALNKARSKYACLLREDTSTWGTLGVSSDIVERMISSHKIEIEVWKHILNLLENEAENI